jgi:hypothetical protein
MSLNQMVADRSCDLSELASSSSRSISASTWLLCVAMSAAASSAAV